MGVAVTPRRVVWCYHRVHGNRVALRVSAATDEVLDFFVLDKVLPAEIEAKLRMAIIGRTHAFVSRFFDRLNAEPSTE